MNEWEELARHHYSHLVPLKEGALEILRHCRQAGIPTALFTACRAPLCRAVLRRFDLEQYFDHIIFAEDIGLEKRDPRCFIRLCELVGTDPKSCTFFDDSPSNCATAKAAGMTVIGVHDQFYAYQREALMASCHRYVRSLADWLQKKA